MREFRCRIILETTLEAKDSEEARKTALSEFAHVIVDEEIEGEDVTVLLEDCGSVCSESNQACRGTDTGACGCRDCWECSSESHQVDLDNLGGFGPQEAQ